MKHLISIAAGLLGLMLTGCVPGHVTSAVGAPPIGISPATQAALGMYLQQVKTTRPGAFAISGDGADSYFVWCADMTCAAISYATSAIERCESLSGKRCVILFVRDQPRIAFARAAEADDSGRHGSNGSPHRDRRQGPHVKEQ